LQRGECIADCSWFKSIVSFNFSPTKSPSAGRTAGPSSENVSENATVSPPFSVIFPDKPRLLFGSNSMSLRKLSKLVPTWMRHPSLPAFLINAVVRP
jgi:hypothetical protein